jgi:hypothetical protein
MVDGRQGRAGESRAPPASAVGDQTVSIEHGVDRADRWTREVGPPLAQPLAELRCAPRRVVLLEADDQGFAGRRQLIRVPIRPATPIAEAADADPLIPLRDLVPVFREMPNSSYRAERQRLVTPLRWHHQHHG